MNGNGHNSQLNDAFLWLCLMFRSKEEVLCLQFIQIKWQNRCRDIEKSTQNCEHKSLTQHTCAVSDRSLFDGTILLSFFWTQHEDEDRRSVRECESERDSMEENAFSLLNRPSVCECFKCYLTKKDLASPNRNATPMVKRK